MLSSCSSLNYRHPERRDEETLAHSIFEVEGVGGHPRSRHPAWLGDSPDEGPLRRLIERPVPRVVLPDLLAEAGEFGGNQFRH